MAKDLRPTKLGMSVDRGYELVRYYTTYHWNGNKFFTLKNSMDLEDAIQFIMAKFLRQGHFEKYNPAITSEKYHIMSNVGRTMIDLLRSQRPADKNSVSIDEKDADGLSVGDTLPSGYLSVEEDVVYQMTVEEILNALPEASWGEEHESALLGKSQFSYRTLFLHMAANWRTNEIAETYGVSSRRINALQKEVREIAARVMDLDMELA